ncbi:thiamine-phosphate kinase [Helicobacter labacensis]|uniref:thiamine-phosphate kinase n=1 Tax=Helicobacter labacensis TaxID=2316079 RepID=UPI000EB23E59|nr:thiamine-phosphate kinase [Helicobacter labacensis]
MDLEAYFLKTLQTSGVTWGIGDDGVLLPPCRGVVCALDIFAQNVHFKPEWLGFERVGYKAMVVNISDMIAMNATPKSALLGVSLDRRMDKSAIRALVTGLKRACKEFHIRIIGGDTIVGDSLHLSITMLGTTRKPLSRKGARLGDYIAHTGTLGQSYKALCALLRGGKPSPKSKFFTPRLKHARFIAQARTFLHAGLDISDGVLAECNRLSECNHLAFKLYKPYERAFKSGEEYEMLFCFAKRDYLALLRRARAHRVRLNLIGKVCRGQSRYRALVWHKN